MTRPRTIEEVLDYCLANPEGLSTDELLAMFPEHRDRLQTLLSVAAGLEELMPAPVPEDRKASMKQRLIDAASAVTTSRAARPVLILLNGKSDHAPVSLSGKSEHEPVPL